jgi:hypothetical protein
MMRAYRQPPPIVSGYDLGDVHKFWIVVPEEGTNLWTNPSFETNTTGATAVGGSIARSTTRQRRGAYSLAITPTAGTGDGAYFGTVSSTSGTTYTYSIDIYGAAGVPYKIHFATTGGVQVGGTKQFKGTGRWQRVHVTYTETSTTTRRLYVTKDASTSTAIFYVDGVQLEAKSYPTTYIDGDLSGLIPNQFPIAYAWTGTPHASTSTRSGQTRAGGRLYPFSRYGFTLLGIAGLGLTTPNVVATPYAQLDGAQYERSQKPPRQFTLAGRFDARTPRHLHELRGDLLSILDRDLVGLDQPIVLQYQQYNCDVPVGDEGKITCVYSGGLEGNTNNHHAEAVSAVFQMHTPGIALTGQGGAALTVQQTVTNGDNAILERTPAGTWQALGSGLNNQVSAIAIHPTTKIVYAGGTFTTAGGSAANFIAAWDPVARTWSALGSGPTYNVRDIAFTANGDVIVTTSNSGGTAGTVERWNGATWTSFGTTTNFINGLAIDRNGNIYVTGAFTTISAVAANRIAYYNGSAWNALGTGLNGTGIGMDLGLDGHIYVGGSFTTAGGTTVNRVAKWNTGTSAWSAMGSGMDDSVRELRTAPNGYIYAGGNFTTAGGISAARIAYWNGTQWQAVGSGMSGGDVYDIAIAPDNTAIYASGDFTTAGSLSGLDYIARSNGTEWVAIDLDFPPATTFFQSLTFASDGTLYVGFGNVSATVAATGITTITNGGTARTYPRVTLKGPSSGTSRVWQIVNTTTGRGVYFNYTMQAGETAVLDFTPTSLSFMGDFQGNISGFILPSSNEADFFLQPGSNTISVFAASSTVTAVMEWTPMFNAADDLVYTV